MFFLIYFEYGWLKWLLQARFYRILLQGLVYFFGKLELFSFARV